MVSANRATIQSLAENGNQRAKRAHKFLQNPEKLLATTLIGTNIATITFSVTTTLAITKLASAPPLGKELLAVVMVTPATLILGEIVPKTIFQHHANKIVLYIATPLQMCSLVLRPAVFVLGALARGVTKLLRGDSTRALVTRAELEFLVDDLDTIHADISDEEREMIANVLDLSDATAEDVMVPLSEVTALSEKTSLKVAALEVEDKQHSRMPVYSNRVDDVIGVVHVFDLLQCKDKDSTVGQLARQPIFVPESRLAIDLLVDLQQTGEHIAIVVDEYGGTVGIVTVEDILEEIVGEIDDEHDANDAQIVLERPNVWRVDARCSVEKVNHKIGVELPESDEYETIAGLLLDHFKQIPLAGDSMVCEGVTIRVLQATEKAVRTIQILRRHKK